MDKLTTTQAAQQLGCSRSAIRKAIKAGRLPAEKAGRDWLISLGDLAKPGSPFGRKKAGFVSD